MYRLFIYIFSMFLLLLTAIPCSDSISIVNTDIVSTRMDHKNTSAEHDDICSPFCACSCCHTTISFSITSIDVKDMMLDHPIDKSFPFYEENLHLNEPIDIWQPPKLS